MYVCMYVNIYMYICVCVYIEYDVTYKDIIRSILSKVSEKCAQILDFQSRDLNLSASNTYYVFFRIFLFFYYQYVLSSSASIQFSHLTSLDSTVILSVLYKNKTLTLYQKNCLVISLFLV